eukprot:GHVU01114040.1.p1 GENE.GHVU01114040.1~~GHVU01114040.1.p1  ORF type:complete len:347 (-),score=83.38 GHVU01114040.1:89-1129(-)
MNSLVKCLFQASGFDELHGGDESESELDESEPSDLYGDSDYDDSDQDYSDVSDAVESLKKEFTQAEEKDRQREAAALAEEEEEKARGKQEPSSTISTTRETDEGKEEKEKKAKAAAEEAARAAAAAAPVVTEVPTEQLRRRSGDLDFSILSDPQHPGLRYCWKFSQPLEARRNWGWLTAYKECRAEATAGKKKSDTWLQETDQHKVCTETGGVDLTHEQWGGDTPFKLRCLDREVAMRSQTHSCWRLLEHFPLLTLKREWDVERVCDKMQPWGFSDGVRVSSRFTSVQGGITGMRACSGGQFESVKAKYRLEPTGVVTGFGEVECLPQQGSYEFGCRGVAVDCVRQ